jgi:hypothetical protein
MKEIIFKDNKFIEWTCRILISINLIWPGLQYSSVSYPLNVLLITLIAFWLYVYNLKIFSILFLLFALFLSFTHVGYECI